MWRKLDNACRLFSYKNLSLWRLITVLSRRCEHSMSEEDVERYLEALAHPVRREVIRALAEKGSLSYTELMRITGVDDSGTFAFHMRMLQGLVCKDPETGDYKLTEEGVRVYKVLSNKWPASILLVGLAIPIAWGTAWKVIWPAFARMNQLLAVRSRGGASNNTLRTR